MSTLLGLSHRLGEQWVSALWKAMWKTGNGYKRDTLARRPPKGAAKWRGERRPDKVARAEREARIPIVTGEINFRRSAR